MARTPPLWAVAVAFLVLGLLGGSYIVYVYAPRVVTDTFTLTVTRVFTHRVVVKQVTTKTRTVTVTTTATRVVTLTYTQPPVTVTSVTTVTLAPEAVLAVNSSIRPAWRGWVERLLYLQPCYYAVLRIPSPAFNVTWSSSAPVWVGVATPSEAKLVKLAGCYGASRLFPYLTLTSAYGSHGFMEVNLTSLYDLGVEPVLVVFYPAPSRQPMAEVALTIKLGGALR